MEVYRRKKDNGLTTGQQEEQTDLKENKTLTLSQGYWDFTLYGYKKIDNEEKLICKGSVLGKLIDKQNTSIFISVQPMQTKDVNGTIVIELTNDAEVTVKRLSDETTVSGSSPYTVSSGTYVVEVKTTTTDGAESTALKYINVYDYLTTTVKGDVTT